MAVEAPGANSAVTGAIRQASRMTGTNFQYLVATARVESRFNPAAAASTSSARGLFQFTEQTRLTTLKEQGTTLVGYGEIANAIERAPSGHYVGDRPPPQRPDHEPARRSDGQCGDGRRLHQGQRGQARQPIEVDANHGDRSAERSARPTVDRR